MVTFSERREKSQGLVVPGFGQDFANKHRIDGFYVKCVGDHWYQYPEMGSAIATIRDRVHRTKEIVTYGSSMGAYAALKFSNALNAKRAVCLSPIFSPDPAKPPFEKRWNSDARRINFIDDDMGKDIRHAAEIFILVDTTHPDARHARLIRDGAPRTITVAVPFASHPVGHFMREAEILTSTMIDIVTGNFDNAKWCQMRRTHRYKSAIYRDRLAAILKRKAVSKSQSIAISDGPI